MEGSFSAVSKPIFARKYALESSRRDLQNALLRTVLESNDSNPKNQENRGEKRTFSSASKPNFARKYALESSRRDLHNALLLCTVLKAQLFVKKIVEIFVNLVQIFV